MKLLIFKFLIPTLIGNKIKRFKRTFFFLIFYKSSALARGQTEDCSSYNSEWNRILKYFEDTTNVNACAVIEYTKEAFKSIKERNPPNWKELVTKLLDSMNERHQYGNIRIFHEFVKSVHEALDRKVGKDELITAIRENKLINKFPMTCIEDFGRAHKVFIALNQKIADTYRKLMWLTLVA